MLFAVYRPIPLSIEKSGLIGDTRHSRIIAYQSMPARFAQLGGNLGGNFDPRHVRRTAGPRRANGVAQQTVDAIQHMGRPLGLSQRKRAYLFLFGACGVCGCGEGELRRTVIGPPPMRR